MMPCLFLSPQQMMNSANMFHGTNYRTKSRLEGDQSCSKISYYIKYTKLNFVEEHQMENKMMFCRITHCAPSSLFAVSNTEHSYKTILIHENTCV